MKAEIRLFDDHDRKGPVLATAIGANFFETESILKLIGGFQENQGCFWNNGQRVKICWINDVQGDPSAGQCYMEMPS